MPSAGVNKLCLIEPPHDISEGLKSQTAIKLLRIPVSDEQHAPYGYHRYELIHQSGSDASTLVIRVNGEVAEGCVVFAVTERAGAAYEPLAVESEAYSRTVLKGPSHLVPFAAAQPRELEQGDQLLPVDAHD